VPAIFCRWFGNTRVVGARELDAFRDAMAARMSDPYSIVLGTKRLPMGLLAGEGTPKTDSADGAPAGSKAVRAHLLSAESFATTFGVCRCDEPASFLLSLRVSAGKSKQRKRVKLAATAGGDLVSLASAAAAASEAYAGPSSSAGEAAAIADRDRDRVDLGPQDRFIVCGLPSIGAVVISLIDVQSREPLFDKGQSKRLWAELYKVLDCSDVVIQV
jgi:nuclear GTP-binding protein